MKCLIFLLLSILTASAQLNLLDTAFVANLTQQVSTNNLLGWWKADSLPSTLTNNSPLGDASIGRQWVDLRNTGNAMVQTTANSRPTYKTSQFASGLPGVAFNGAQFFSLSNALAFNTNFTMFVVVFQTAANDGIILGNAVNNRQVRANRAGLNQWSFYDGTNSEAISTTYTLAITVAKLSTCRRTNTVVSFRENKTAKSGGTAAAAPTYDQVGQSVGSIGTTPLNGTVGEIILYSGYIVDADVDALYDSYFKPRWGLP